MFPKTAPRLALFIVAFLTISSHRALAGTPQERLNAIVRDTQKQGNRAGRVTLVWWVPSEFWRAALGSSGTMPAEKAEEMMKSISMIDRENKPVTLLSEAKQSSATKNLLAVMKPLLANMLGELGKNLSYFVFEGKIRTVPVVSIRKDPGFIFGEGENVAVFGMTVRLSGEEFHWRLPLGSLLAQKSCPKCQEVFPGNYALCPFDATPLKELAPAK